MATISKRGAWARVLVVLATVVLVLAVLAGYARRALVDSDQFANRATAALRSAPVRALIADRITDDVVLARNGDLLAARPLIASVAEGVVGGRAFTSLFRAGVRDVHAAVFAHDENTVTLTLRDVGTVLAAAVEKVQPSLARQLEQDDRVTVVREEAGGIDAALVSGARLLRTLSVVLGLLWLVLTAAALWVARDRRRAAVELGFGAAIGGVVIVLLCVLARAALAARATSVDSDAVKAVFDAFADDLRTAGWVLAGCGAIVAAAGRSVLKPVELRDPLRRAAAWVGREPLAPAWRAVRAVALVAAGVIVLLARDAVVGWLVAAAGIALVYYGVTALLVLIYDPELAAQERARRSPRRLVPVVLAGVLVAVAIGAFAGTGGVSTAAPRTGKCNGHTELCDRSLPEVALAATHNSMSAPLPGWYSSAQDAGLPEQLDAGIHGLLIDTHYADKLAGGRLRTVLDEGGPERVDGVSPDAVNAAMRIRDRLGFSGSGTRGMYLCHSFCELGGTPLAEALDAIHDFLVTHPDEVLVVVNQDYVRPADFVAAVDEAGLGELAYRGPTTGRWPTLREMIDGDQRVVFMAENEAGAAPWYHLVYDRITEETPYHFSRTAQLTDPSALAASCAPNRGPAGAPLFLVNHWVTTDPLPKPSDASIVNARAPLLARLRACADIRHHFPNLVAVNFYRRGDLFEVVDELNRVR